MTSSENVDYVLGYIRNAEGQNAKIEGMEHCFCNALLNYSGEIKLQQAETNLKEIEAMEQIINSYDSDSKSREVIKHLEKDDPLKFKIITTKREHPELKVSTQFYFDKLKSIEGELIILGMSTNNDNFKGKSYARHEGVSI